MARTSFTLVMLGIAAVMALLLGVFGIYGVTSYAVSQRRREIVIRMAPGAQGREILGLFRRRGLIVTGAGVALGLGGAAGFTQVMRAFLFGVSPSIQWLCRRTRPARDGSTHRELSAGAQGHVSEPDGNYEGRVG